MTPEEKTTEKLVEEAVKKGVAEIIIRQGKALEVLPPVKVEIKGTIQTPLVWIKQRISLISLMLCHILFDKDKGMITFVEDETNPYGKTITGELEIDPTFELFGINEGKYRSPIEMAEFFKMNRSCFANQAASMSLVASLKKFKAKVDKEVEQEININRGDRRLVLNQVVESNVPEKFTLLIPVFKGQPRQEIEVETYFNPNDMTCTLVSPAAKDYIDSFKGSLIDDQIKMIVEIAPGIPIIEQ